MTSVLTFPLRAVWWLIAAAVALVHGTLASLLWLIRAAIGGILWLIGSRFFLAVPGLVFLVPLLQGVNVPADVFYPAIGGSIALHFLCRWLAPIVLPKRKKLTLRIPEAPKLTLPRREPRPSARQPIAAPARLPDQPRLPRPSPVLQTLRPYHPAASPTEQAALAHLPPQVRQLIQPAA